MRYVIINNDNKDYNYIILLTKKEQVCIDITDNESFCSILIHAKCHTSYEYYIIRIQRVIISEKSR